MRDFGNEDFWGVTPSLPNQTQQENGEGGMYSSSIRFQYHHGFNEDPIFQEQVESLH